MTNKIVRIPNFLSGDFGKDFLKEYQGRAKADYKNARVLKVLRVNGDVVSGSNPYAVVLANKILRQEGLRTATPADIEEGLKSGELDLKEVNVDTGLVLRTKDELNEYLARDLIKQLGKQKLPVMIPLAGLDLRVDKKAPNGLAFNIREDTEVIYDEVLGNQYGPQGGRFNSEDINEKTGLPNKLGNGNRGFYTTGFGLSRFYLSSGSSLVSDSRLFALSNKDGRIVVVKDEK